MRPIVRLDLEGHGNMKIDEISEGDRYEYKKICTCGNMHTILTQRDNRSEYETGIYVLCECKEYVEFILPVN